MNIWAVVAVIAALVFGFCVGYIIANLREKKYNDDLCKRCNETSEQLAKVSREYEEFIKAAQELDRWPNHITHITMRDNLADYLKTKYFGDETVDCDEDYEAQDDIDRYT